MLKVVEKPLCRDRLLLISFYIFVNIIRRTSSKKLSVEKKKYGTNIFIICFSSISNDIHYYIVSIFPVLSASTNIINTIRIHHDTNLTSQQYC